MKLWREYIPLVPGTLDMYSVNGSCLFSDGLWGYCGGFAAKMFTEASDRASMADLEGEKE